MTALLAVDLVEQLNSILQNYIVKIFFYRQIGSEQTIIALGMECV